MFHTISLRIMAALQTASARDLRREEGQTLVEYALILVLISIASIAALGLLSGKINGVLTTITDTL
jgi:pilus assembly protein Flp/PilA